MAKTCTKRSGVAQPGSGFYPTPQNHVRPVTFLVRAWAKNDRYISRENVLGQRSPERTDLSSVSPWARGQRNKSKINAGPA